MLPDQDVDTVVWPGTDDAQSLESVPANFDLDAHTIAMIANMDPHVTSGLTQKQTAFVRYMLAGVPQTEAARRAGYSDPGNAAFLAKKNEDVAQIIHAHRTSMFSEAKVAGGITLGTHLARLGDLSHRAEEAGEFGAAIAAETNRGKASGLYVHKTAAEQAADEAGAATSILKLRGMMERIAKRGGK